MSAERGTDSGGVYELRVQGELGPLLEGWFADMTVERECEAVLVIRGAVADQAALHGLFARLHTLQLLVLEIRRLPPSSDSPGR
jgi:hypothetical protein